MNKKLMARLRRLKKTRIKIKKLKALRLCVHRTARHIYAQIISADGSVVASAATVGKEFKKKHKNTGGIKAAVEIGRKIAKLAKDSGVSKVSFDRSGFMYHGRIKALADAAREGGLDY